MFDNEKLKKACERSVLLAQLVNSINNDYNVIMGYYPELLLAYTKTATELYNNVKDEKKKYYISNMKKVLNKYSNGLKKMLVIIAAPAIDDIRIHVEFSRGDMGAMQAKAYYTDNFTRLEGDKTVGYGYDKESTSIADVINNARIYKLILDYYKNNNIPIPIGYSTENKLGYGMHINEYTGRPSFDGGVGTECFLAIFRKLGFTVFSDYSGKKNNYYHIYK